MTRVYSAKEVMIMRQGVKALLLSRRGAPPDARSIDAIVEDQLRTYIAAAVDPADFEGIAAEYRRSCDEAAAHTDAPRSKWRPPMSGKK